MKPRIRHKNGFEVLRAAIPDHHEEIASLVGVGISEVYRWQSPPESNEQPMATGRRSPLDRVLDLISAIYLHHPEGALLVVDHVVAHLDRLRHTHRRSDWDAHEAVAEATATLAQVIADLGDGQITDSDVKQWRKLKAVVDEGFEQVGAIWREGKATT